MCALAAQITVAQPRIETGKIGAKGDVDIEIEFDQDKWSADSPITGHVVLYVNRAVNSSNKELKYVQIKATEVNLQFENTTTEATLTIVNTKIPILNPTRVRRKQRVRFSINIDPKWREALGGSGARMFNPGKHRIKATFDTRRKRKGLPLPTALTDELSGLFESEWIPIEIKSGFAAPTGRQRAKSAIDSADDALKIRATKFFATRKVLTYTDVLSLIDQSAIGVKVPLSAFYVSQKYPLDKLTLFKPLSGQVNISNHQDGPVYFRVIPQQKIQIHFNARELHDFKSQRLRRKTLLVLDEKTIDVTAPRSQGIYQADCDVHKKPWFFMLVARDRSSE